MAYMSQDHKAQLSPAIKAVCKEFGFKASISVDNHSTLVLRLSEGTLDMIGNCNKRLANDPAHHWGPIEGCLDVNHYHYHNHFTGKPLKFLEKIIPLMYGPDYFDHSDIQSDYFSCSHYISVKVGSWNKPYVLKK